MSSSSHTPRGLHRSLSIAWLGGIVAMLLFMLARQAWGPDTITLSPLRELPPAEHADGPIRGVAINAHHISNLPLYLQAVDRIADLGADTLLLTTPHFQSRADSTVIRRLEERCSTEVQLRAILQRAKARGLRTVLQPVVLIEHPGETDWRGVIQPSDWDQWWSSYAAFIDFFLTIAIEEHVDVFSVGSELNSTEHQVDRWRTIIRRVRAQFDGRVIYTANWDRYEAVPFWRLLDMISISSYFELAKPGESPDDAALTAAWATVRDALTAFAHRQGWPLFLSEVGYPSLPTALARPWDYVNRDNHRADHAAQASGFRAFFRAWSDQFSNPDNHVAGFVIYHWDPYHRGGGRDTGYGFFGKPAYDIIRTAMNRLAETARPAND